MPYNPPATSTQTGNSHNLYLLSNQGITDPLIINDLVVMNRATITDLTVASGTITLSDTAGNQTLQAIGTDLFYDGQLIAKANDLQNISDWADYPAISNINVNNKNIVNVKELDFQTNVLTTDTNNNLTYNGNIVSTQKGVTSLDNLTGDVNLTSTGSTILITNNTETNSINLEIEKGVTSLDNLTGDINLTSTGSTITITKNTETNSINLESQSSSIVTWSQYPATSDVKLNGNKLTDTTVNIVGDNLLGVTKGTVNINAKNGIGGLVAINADSGTGGVNGGLVTIKAQGGQLYGEVDIDAYAGTSGSVTTGGSINLTAHSGLNDISLTSKITLSAASVLSYAGAISPIASTAGYNYVFGQLGVSILGGSTIPAVIPNTPGTIFMYASNGVEIPSDIYSTNIFPYWDGNTLTPSPLLISGRQILALPKTLVHIQDVDHIYMGGNGAITGVNSINGQPYPPTSGGNSSISNGATSVTCGADGSIVSVTDTTKENPEILFTGNLTSNFGINTEGYISLQTAGSLIKSQPDGFINITNSFASPPADILIQNNATSLTLGLPTDTPPSTGLYIDNSRILFNGTSLLSPIPAPQPVSVTPLTIIAGTTKTYNLQISDVGSYFVLNTSDEGGGYILDFEIPAGLGFNSGATFFIKNIDTINSITITVGGNPVAFNNILYPINLLTSNGFFCLAYWDGLNLYIY